MDRDADDHGSAAVHWFLRLGQRQIQTGEKFMTWSRARLEISGPLAPYAAGFTEWLGHNGYAPTTVRTHQRRMIRLNRRMQTAGTDSAEFGPATVAAFISAQGAVGRFLDWKAGSWAALLRYPRSFGVSLAEPRIQQRELDHATAALQIAIDCVETTSGNASALFGL
ncbi:hypothetical protein [Lentzea sp. NPDC055074]